MASMSPSDAPVLVARVHRALNLPEVLARILELSIPKISCTDSEGPPWTFLLVSKFWNKVVVNTPSLWTTFSVVKRYPRYEDIRCFPSKLGLYLKRSGGLPLTLMLSFTLTRYFKDTDKSLETIRTLLQRAQEGRERWQAFSFRFFVNREFAVHIPSPIVFSISLGDSPVLRQLDLNISPNPYVHAQVELSRCPLLRRLSLKTIVPIVDRRSEDDLTSADDFFPALTTVSLHALRLNRRVPACWLLLDLAPNVENLTIDVVAPDYTNPSMSTIALPKLRSLAISYHEAWDALRAMSTPSLSKLELLDVSKDVNFVTFPSHLSSIPVDHLSLRISDTFEVDADMPVPLAFMEHMGGLQQLSFKNAKKQFLDVFSSFLRSSSPESGQQNLVLPHLKTLHLELSRDTFSRINVFTTLKDLTLACFKKYPCAFIMKIRFELAYDDILTEDDVYTEDEWDWDEILPWVDPYRIRIGEEENLSWEAFCEDPEVIACCSEEFRIYANGLELGVLSRYFGAQRRK